PTTPSTIACSSPASCGRSCSRSSSSSAEDMVQRRGRIKPRASRPARVPTPGLYGRLGDIDCLLGNLSPTGALLLTRHELPLDTDWSLQLHFPSGTITVACRVV